MLDGKFFIKLANSVVPMFRKHIFINALDVKGKTFPNYDKSPESIKYGEAKRSGRLHRQATEFANSTAPVASTDLLRDYKLVKTTKSGFQFGFPTQGGKVLSLAKKGRFISTEAMPVPKKINEYIMNEMTKDVKGAFKKIRKKIKRKKINIKIK